MAVKIHGVNKLVQELESRFGTQQMTKVSKRALDKASLLVGMELQRQIKTFSDGQYYSQGYTLAEITITDPRGDGSDVSVTIHWKGRHNRYRIIHLNEWGYMRNGRFIKPRGFGKIAKALQIVKKPYAEVIRNEMRGAI